MTPAVLTAITALCVAGLTLLGVLSGHILGRVHGLEGQLDDMRQYNRELWAYTRRLLDLYYRHRRDGSPDPDPLPEERP